MASWHFGDYHFFFAMAIDSYNMLPLWAVELMARVLPLLEAALGALLISGLALRWVGSITSALLLVFIGAMTRALILHIQIKCGCFGNDETLDAFGLCFATAACSFWLWPSPSVHFSSRNGRTQYLPDPRVLLPCLR